jgi:hypothetical protein
MRKFHISMEFCWVFRSSGMWWCAGRRVFLFVAKVNNLFTVKKHSPYTTASYPSRYESAWLDFNSSFNFCYPDNDHKLRMWTEHGNGKLTRNWTATKIAMILRTTTRYIPTVWTTLLNCDIRPIHPKDSGIVTPCTNSYLPPRRIPYFNIARLHYLCQKKEKMNYTCTQIGERWLCCIPKVMVGWERRKWKP